MVSMRGIPAVEEDRTPWSHCFYTLGGGHKGGLIDP